MFVIVYKTIVFLHFVRLCWHYQSLSGV